MSWGFIRVTYIFYFLKKLIFFTHVYGSDAYSKCFMQGSRPLEKNFEVLYESNAYTWKNIIGIS